MSSVTLGNVSSLLLHQDYLCSIETEILCMSESRLTEAGIKEAKLRFDEAGWTLRTSPPQAHRRNDPTRTHGAIPGGVAIATRKCIPAAGWEFADPRWTPELLKRCLGVSATSLCGHEPYRVLVLYGYADARSDPVKANLNETLLELAFAEANACGDMPVLVVGDFNTTVGESLMLTTQVNSGNWADIAHVKANARGETPVDTFLSNRNGVWASSRNDLCLMNSASLERFLSFEVLDDATCIVPNHKFQQVTLKTGRAPQRALRTQKPRVLPEHEPLPETDRLRLADEILSRRLPDFEQAIEGQDPDLAWEAWCHMTEDWLLEHAAIASGNHTCLDEDEDAPLPVRGLCADPSQTRLLPPRQYSSEGELMNCQQLHALKAIRLVDELDTELSQPSTPERVDQAARLWAKCREHGGATLTSDSEGLLGTDRHPFSPDDSLYSRRAGQEPQKSRYFIAKEKTEENIEGEEERSQGCSAQGVRLAATI